MFNKREHKAIPEVGTVWRGTVSHEDLVSFIKNINNEKVKSVELKIYNGIPVMK